MNIANKLLQSASFMALFGFLTGIVLMSLEDAVRGNWLFVISGLFLLILEYVVLVRTISGEYDAGKAIILFLALVLYGGVEMLFYMGFDFTVMGKVCALVS